MRACVRVCFVVVCGGRCVHVSLHVALVFVVNMYMHVCDYISVCVYMCKWVCVCACRHVYGFMVIFFQHNNVIGEPLARKINI